jgi:hypothetical protein
VCVGGIVMGTALLVVVVTGRPADVPQNLRFASSSPPVEKDRADSNTPSVVTRWSLRRPLGSPLPSHS